MGGSSNESLIKFQGSWKIFQLPWNSDTGNAIRRRNTQSKQIIAPHLLYKIIGRMDNKSIAQTGNMFYHWDHSHL